MQNTNSTVILLMNRQSGADANFVKKWLANSRFQTEQAMDIFQAIETISDFTGAHRPEVVLLEVDSIAEDMPLIRQLAVCASGETDVPLMILSDSKNVSYSGDYFVGSMKQLQSKLDQIFPETFHYRAAA